MPKPISPTAKKVWRSWNGALAELRLDTHMTQEIFGDYIGGFTRSQINRYESGLAEPPIRFWIQISEIFGVSIQWMLTGKGSPHVQAG